MTTLDRSLVQDAAHVAAAGSSSAVGVTAPSAALVRAILLHALLLGVAADALLRAGPAGIGFPLWIALLAMTATALAWRGGRTLPGEARGWLLVAILFAVGLAWRDSEMLQVYDCLATIGALAMAAIALHDRSAALFAARARDTLFAGMRLARDVAVGVVPLVLRDLVAPPVRVRTTRGLWPALRAALLAGVLLIVFGALLRDADPVFASIVSLPDLDGLRLLSHLVVIGFFGWIVAGWARGALAARVETRPRAELPFELGALDVTAALGTLIVLFAAFVVTQLGWFFGGEPFLRARTGLTAAAYARGGFFQLLWVVLLVVPLLVATRAALGPGRALARRHTALSLPLLALVGAIILSATSRMRLYVHYYGLTTDRFYPLVFMGWLAFVLVWLALTVLRGRERYFVSGAVISGACVLAALNVVSPDAIVARANVARATAAGSVYALDVAHLARLSGDAAALAVRETLAPPAPVGDAVAARARDAGRCSAASELLRRWGPSSRAAERGRDIGAWREWNAGAVAARHTVAQHAPALRALRHATCAGAAQRQR